MRSWFNLRLTNHESIQGEARDRRRSDPQRELDLALPLLNGLLLSASCTYRLWLQLRLLLYVLAGLDQHLCA